MLQDHRIFCWQKNRGGFGLIYYVSNSTNLRELLGGVCLSGICLEICLVEKKIKNNNGLPKFASGPPFGGRPDKKPYPQSAM